MTPHEIRDIYTEKGRELEENRHFFDRDTMRFFGDTMASFGVRKIGRDTFMYRKADAMINMFGKTRRAGRDCFNAWLFDPVSGDLNNCNKELTAEIYGRIYGDEDGEGE